MNYFELNSSFVLITDGMTEEHALASCFYLGSLLVLVLNSSGVVGKYEVGLRR